MPTGWGRSYRNSPYFLRGGDSVSAPPLIDSAALNQNGNTHRTRTTSIQRARPLYPTGNTFSTPRPVFSAALSIFCRTSLHGLPLTRADLDDRPDLVGFDQHEIEQMRQERGWETQRKKLQIAKTWTLHYRQYYWADNLGELLASVASVRIAQGIFDVLRCQQHSKQRLSPPPSPPPPE